MTDTVRTYTELQTLLADNSIGAISPQDLRDFMETYAQNVQILKTTYRDYMSGGSRLKTSGANVPSYAAFVGDAYAYEFVHTGLKEAFFEMHLQHDYKVGTPINIHVHWGQKSAAAAGTGNVRWYCSYTLAKGYGAAAFSNTSTSMNTIQANGAQYVHMITNDDDMTIPGTGLEPDMLILCKIWRDGTDGSDTFNDSAFLLSVDAHVQVGQYGTEERNRPFTSSGFSA